MIEVVMTSLNNKKHRYHLISQSQLVACKGNGFSPINMYRLDSPHTIWAMSETGLRWPWHLSPEFSGVELRRADPLLRNETDCGRNSKCFCLVPCFPKIRKTRLTLTPNNAVHVQSMVICKLEISLCFFHKVWQYVIRLWVEQRSSRRKNNSKKHVFPPFLDAVTAHVQTCNGCWNLTLRCPWAIPFHVGQVASMRCLLVHWSANSGCCSFSADVKWCEMYRSQTLNLDTNRRKLVGGFNPSEKYWDDYSQYMEKQKMFAPGALLPNWLAQLK